MTTSKQTPAELAAEIKLLAEQWSKGKVATGMFFTAIDRLAALATAQQAECEPVQDAIDNARRIVREHDTRLALAPAQQAKRESPTVEQWCTNAFNEAHGITPADAKEGE